MKNVFTRLHNQVKPFGPLKDLPLKRSEPCSNHPRSPPWRPTPPSLWGRPRPPWKCSERKFVGSSGCKRKPSFCQTMGALAQKLGHLSCAALRTPLTASAPARRPSWHAASPCRPPDCPPACQPCSGEQGTRCGICCRQKAASMMVWRTLMRPLHSKMPSIHV